ncbi:ABC transporter ATP-binding protein [Gemmatimonas sp.]|uniref:ABC transporter ATP-binding protein n=1 Tax=Gemmatimonas sp. TaxID=1962908 RepID=UPI0033402C45
MLVELDDVAFAYSRRTPVLTNISLTIRPEEVVALLGRNGAGKSTLIHLIMGLLRPGRGTARTFGLDPIEHPVAVKQRIGFVSEQQGFPPTMTGRALVDLHRALYPTWDRALELELIERFELQPVLGSVLKVSKGQRQQLALLCAVCHRPPLLVLDEPASGLDPAMRREFLDTAIRLLNREGTAILFSSHHLGDVERMGGRAVLLHEGRAALDAPLDTLRESHVLAVAPRAQVTDADWQRVPGVRRLRAVGDAWHAVIAVESGGTAVSIADQTSMVRMALRCSDAECAVLSLEELFVEYTGKDVERSALEHSGTGNGGRAA